MPFEIEERGGTLFVGLLGIVTDDDFDALAIEAERLESMHPGLHRLIDMTRVERFDVDFWSMFQLARKRTGKSLQQPIRSAIIARRPTELHFARLSRLLNQNPAIEINIVSDIEEALRWLAEARASVSK